MTVARPCPKCGGPVGGPSPTFHLVRGKEGCPLPGEVLPKVIRINPGKSGKQALDDILDRLAADPTVIARIEEAMKQGPPTGPPPPGNWCGGVG